MFVLTSSLAATSFFFLFCFLRTRTAELDFAPADLMICAAHSDDCVIMGAEMAQQVLAAEHCVEIVYLTCSAPSPEMAIAQKRAEEALIAWKAVGVPAEKLHFIDIPESPLGGMPSYGQKEIDQATDWLTNRFRELLPGACVLIPAEGESHVDHRTMRTVSLLALERAGQAQKVTLYEVTEYNPYLSMLQDPLAVLNRLTLSLPLLGRAIPRRWAAPGFMSGPPGMQFHSPASLTAKLTMLGAFPSQNPPLLRTYFGSPSRYRRITAPAEAMKPVRRRHFDFLGAKSDASVLVFFALVALSVFGLFLALSQAGFAVSAILGLGLAGLFSIALARRRYPCASLCGAACVGLIAGLA